MPYIECPSLSSFILDAWPDALASTAQTAATRSVIIVRHLQLLRELSYYVPRRAPPARHARRSMLAALPRVHACLAPRAARAAADGRTSGPAAEAVSTVMQARADAPGLL